MRYSLLPILVLYAALLPGIVGCKPASPPPSESLAEALDDTALEHALKHARPTYVCPMHPQIVRTTPGTCPICGMDLVVMAADEQEDTPQRPAVRVEGAVSQAMNLRTERAVRGDLTPTIATVGYVDYDENRLYHVHSRARGWIESMKVRAAGDRVEKGQVLLEYYAPEIVTAQQEYLVARRSSPSLVENARTRLELLEVPEGILRSLEQGGGARRAIPLSAPRAGVVVRLGIREGMYVGPEMELYTIADLSPIWVLVDIFEHQHPWVEVGLPAEIRVAAVPGRVWRGRVEYLYPELTERTRTLRVRLAFANPDGALKPNMFADVVLFGKPSRSVLHIAEEALILEGDGARVVRRTPEGRFQPVPVTPGLVAGGRVQIREGLEEGAEVVVSGQFLIDSESNLRASLRRLTSADGGMGHGAHP